MRAGHQADACAWIIRFSYQTILFARPRFSAMSHFLPHPDRPAAPARDDAYFAPLPQDDAFISSSS
jgi:hypothetical protein